VLQEYCGTMLAQSVAVGSVELVVVGDGKFTRWHRSVTGVL
jgi:hypothetical protein